MRDLWWVVQIRDGVAMEYGLVELQTAFLLVSFFWWEACFFLMRSMLFLMRNMIFLMRNMLFLMRNMIFLDSVDWVGKLQTSRPQWLSWMRRPTGDQEVAGSTPAEVGNILSWRLIMKYFLRSFSPFRWFKKGSCQFLAKECAQYWLTA